MSPPLLTFLKYIFLAVLYLFFLRVLRAVWIELREPKVVAPEPVEDHRLEQAFAAIPQSTRRGTQQDRFDASDVTTAAAGLDRPSLVVTEPAEHAGASYPLTGELTVGRSAGSAISLPDDTFVSQAHARLFRHDGEWWVEDLGSTNGTYVNNGRIASPVVIRSGDRVQFGQTVAEVRP